MGLSHEGEIKGILGSLACDYFRYIAYSFCRARLNVLQVLSL